MKHLTRPTSTLKRSFIRNLAIRVINIEANILKDQMEHKDNVNKDNEWSCSQQWAFIRGMEFLLDFLENHKDYPMYTPEEVYPSKPFKTRFSKYISQARLTKVIHTKS